MRFLSMRIGAVSGCLVIVSIVFHHPQHDRTIRLQEYGDQHDKHRAEDDVQRGCVVEGDRRVDDSRMALLRNPSALLEQCFHHERGHHHRSGTLPTGHVNDATAISGPTTAPQIIARVG